MATEGFGWDVIFLWSLASWEGELAVNTKLDYLAYHFLGVSQLTSTCVALILIWLALSGGLREWIPSSNLASFPRSLRAYVASFVDSVKKTLLANDLHMDRGFFVHMDWIHTKTRNLSSSWNLGKPWFIWYTSSSRASRWRKFQKKKELYSKERICL